MAVRSTAAALIQTEYKEVDRMIHVILPYEDAPRLYPMWAHEEQDIDFRRDHERAARCTVCFAAEELVSYLAKTGLSACVSGQPGDITITMTLRPEMDQTFSVETGGNTVSLTGGRRGLLYAAYHVLEAQDIRWYSPWEEYVPENLASFTMPEAGSFSPDMPLGRGFEFEGPLKESALLYLWMARNRLNMAACRPNTKHLQRKLGMSFQVGGHIFEHILEPSLPAGNGQTLIEAHPDWYGQPINRDNPLSVQFCTSNEELLEYLAQHLIRLLMGEWYDADRIELWGFDTWGNTCRCEKCRALGNGTDKLLHFLSYLRKRIDEETAKGNMDHPVQLVMGAYEGTSTIEPPENGFPENLLASGDYAVYWPILRCYEHPLKTPCMHNEVYTRTLPGWTKMPTILGEYYNVSRYEDLPLQFTRTIQEDFRWYHEIGVKGMTYMHLPMVEWGMRALTQVLFARLAWDVNADLGKIISKYFMHLYGPFAETARKAYELTEEATKHIAGWRNWNSKSIYSHLAAWDGKKPDKPLFRDDHLGDNAVSMGLHSADLLSEAADLLRSVWDEADLYFVGAFTPASASSLSPALNHSAQKKNALSERIARDLRSLDYAQDMYLLIANFLKYHEKLLTDSETDATWAEIKRLYRRMYGYTFGVTYSCPDPELVTRDALERSGLKTLYYRCLKERQ